MPQEVIDIKQFLEICRRKDARWVCIKRMPGGNIRVVKFKCRCKRYIYTLRLRDPDKAEKLKQSLPPGLQIQDVKQKNTKGKKS